MAKTLVISLNQFKYLSVGDTHLWFRNSSGNKICSVYVYTLGDVRGGGGGGETPSYANSLLGIIRRVRCQSIIFTSYICTVSLIL